MLFSARMDAYLEDALISDVEELLRLKMTCPEIGEGKRLDLVNAYIDRTIAETEEEIKRLPTTYDNGWEEP